MNAITLLLLLPVISTVALALGYEGAHSLENSLGQVTMALQAVLQEILEIARLAPLAQVPLSVVYLVDLSMAYLVWPGESDMTGFVLAVYRPEQDQLPLEAPNCLLANML